MNLYIRKLNGWIIIKADGYKEWKYMYYNERDAISKYRERFNLKYKHMTKIML